MPKKDPMSYFRTPKKLEKKWEEYKEYCDNKTAVVHEFSQRLGTFVTQELKKPVSYSIKGFCIYAKVPRSVFYEHYINNKEYTDIVTRMRDESETDKAQKFEQGVLPTQLAGLWMSKYGYTTKTEQNISGSVPVIISGEESLED